MLTGIAEALLEWADDRFGRAAAWAMAIVLIVGLTVGVVAFGLLVFG